MKETNESKKFDPEIYSKISIDKLLVYSVKSILDAGEECTFERLVYEAFTLFPKEFGFQRYPEWPDSARINKSWLRCRTDKGWIAGTTKEGFKLTRAGEIIAQKTERILGHDLSQRSKKNGKTRERYEAVIDYIMNSLAYKKYEAGNYEEITFSDFVTFLGGTLETPRRILRHNLNLYFDAVRIYKRDELLPFLQFCKKEVIKMKD